MLFAKLASAFLIHRVVPQTLMARFGLYTMVVLWGVFACFSVAFRCGGIAEWDTQQNHCHSSGPLIASIVLNMVTDLLLASWLFPALFAVALDLETRLAAMALFGSRAVYVIGSESWRMLTIQSSCRSNRTDMGRKKGHFERECHP
jgi:hypothetical protein